MPTEQSRELKEQLGEVLMNFAGLEVHVQDFDIKKLRTERKFIGETVANVMLQD